MINNSLLPNASGYIITNANNLVSYARILSQYHHIAQNQQRRFLQAADDLVRLRNKWQNGTGICLSESDVAVLYGLGDLLTNNSINSYFISNSIYDKLAKFWSSIQHIPDNRVGQVVTGESIAGAPLASLSFDKLSAVRENTNLMINTVVDRNYNNINNMLILDIPTILLTIMIRSEAHEYILEKILQRTEELTKNKIDIPDLLSVAHKEPKGEHKYKPDTRAMRDAIAHAKFKIENDSMGDFIIYFNNTDEGYSFEKTLSRKDLLGFYQDYDRMTIIYTELLTIRLLYSFLNMNFVYI
ncbi:MAG: hypothetical protein WBQ25_05010 [Nitrososphaeraceae archaeon]